jgi:Protein of unknown function (DUF3455)
MRVPFAVFLLLDLCSYAQTPPAVPGNLKPPAGATLIRRLHATGDQIYACDGAHWVLSRPDARLFDDSGKQVGSHFAGPTWEYSDGSRVTGKAIASATPDPASIPWLLVQAIDHRGHGLLERVTTIQRLSTKGGVAPATGCDAQHKGQESRSHYAADYLFYVGP